MVGSLAGRPESGQLRVLILRRPAVLGLIPGRRAAGSAAAHALMPAARMGQRPRAVAWRPAHDHSPWAPLVTGRTLPGIRPPSRTGLPAHLTSRTHIRAWIRDEAGSEPASPAAALRASLARPRFCGAGSLIGEFAFACVRGQLARAAEFGPRLGGPAELHQQVAADAGEKMIGAQRRLVGDLVYQGESGLRAERHRHRHRAV